MKTATHYWLKNARHRKQNFINLSLSSEYRDIKPWDIKILLVFNHIEETFQTGEF